MTVTATIDPSTGREESPPIFIRNGLAYESTIGGYPATLTGVNCPVDVAVSPLSAEQTTVYVLNRIAESVSSRPRTYFVPIGLDSEPSGDLMIPAPDGLPLARAIDGDDRLPMPVCATLDKDGRIFSTDEYRDRVLVMSTDGTTSELWGKSGDSQGDLNGPAGIAVDGEGRVWVANGRNHRIQCFTVAGQYVQGWGQFGSGPGELDHPWGVAISPEDGTVLVADWRNHRIQRFTEDGECLQVVGRHGPRDGEFDHPSGVAVDQHGDIYVADRGNNRVQVFDRGGQFLEVLTGSATFNGRILKGLASDPVKIRERISATNVGFERPFDRPTSVRVDGNSRIYVVDSGRHRIQVFQKRWSDLAGLGATSLPGTSE